MRSLMLCIMAVIVSCIKLSAQCRPISKAEITNTCYVLKTLMECQLDKKDFEKALPLYFTFTTINATYGTPDDVKDYFNHILDKNKNDFEGIKISISKTADPISKPFKSTMPRVVVITQ